MASREIGHADDAAAADARDDIARDDHRLGGMRGIGRIGYAVVKPNERDGPFVRPNGDRFFESANRDSEFDSRCPRAVDRLPGVW